jgi:hypothetical protein
MLLLKNKKFIFALALVLLFNAVAFVVEGSSGGTAPPGGGPAPLQQNFFAYLKYLFPFMLSIAAVLAVFMLVISGIQMMAAAGNVGMIDSAKKKIWNAIGGLLLIALSFLILRTINPQLINLQLTPITVQKPGAQNVSSPTCIQQPSTITGGVQCVAEPSSQSGGITIFKFSCPATGGIFQSGISSNDAFQKCSNSPGCITKTIFQYNCSATGGIFQSGISSNDAFQKCKNVCQ